MSVSQTMGSPAQYPSYTTGNIASGSRTVGAVTGRRKRVDSDPPKTPDGLAQHKRLRMDTSSSFLDSPTPSLDESIQMTLNSCPRYELLLESSRRKSLSRRSSMTTSSRGASPMFNPLVGVDTSLRARIILPKPESLRRTVSMASLGSPAPVEVTYEPESGRNCMRNPKFVVDFATPTSPSPVIPPPPPVPAPMIIPGLPPFDPPPQPPHITDPRLLTPPVNPLVLSCSQTGILFFTRSNRLHFKNLLVNEEVGQVCKLQDIHGTFTAVCCGGETNPDVVAVATTKGIIAIYDVLSKKRVMSWTSSNPVSTLAWNDKILSAGYTSGSIRHFDTRVTPIEKMKEQAATVTRHQSAITRMEWSLDLEVLASADKRGNVFCWNLADKVPLDVGDFGQRRKKMKHAGAVSALSWCPWQRKVLLTADVKGVIHFWRIDPKIKESNALTPAKIETGAAITSLHWTVQCKEFITTHGYKVPPPTTPPPSNLPLPPPYRVYQMPTPQKLENTLAVWQFPTIRFVTNMRMNTTDIPLGNAVTYAQSTKIVFTVPEESKIYACDVWGKRKVVKLRRQSTLDYAGLIR